MERDDDYRLSEQGDPLPESPPAEPVAPQSDPTPAAPVDEPSAPEPQPEADARSAEQRRQDAAFAAQRRRIDALEGELARLRETQAAPAPQQGPTIDPNAPRREWFQGNDEAYMQALSAYHTSRLLGQQQQQQAWTEQRKDWESQERQMRSAHPDYDDVVDRLDVPFHSGLLHAIHRSPQGPQLAYHLATHPEEAQQIAALPPAQGLWEIARIAGTLSPPNGTAAAPRATPPLTPKPAPPTTVGPAVGSVPTSVEPDQMDYDQYVQWYQRTFGTRW